MSNEKRESIFSTSEFDVNELDIYISDLRNVLDTENITEVISQGKELLDSLSWIKKLSDHYEILKTKVQEVHESTTSGLEDIVRCMEGFETIAKQDCVTRQNPIEAGKVNNLVV